MPWTAPRTWVTNEIVTAALLNTHVRDNLDWLADGPVAEATLGGATVAGAWATAGLTSVSADGLTVGASALTVTRDGRYLFVVYAQSTGGTAVVRGLRLSKGGVLTIAQDGTDTMARSYSCSMIVSLLATDTMQAHFFSATASETISGRLAGYWLRD